MRQEEKLQLAKLDVYGQQGHEVPFLINIHMVSFLFDVIYFIFIVMTMYSRCMFMYHYPD